VELTRLEVGVPYLNRGGPLPRELTITFGPWAPFLWASFDDAMGKAIFESHGALDFVYLIFLYMYKPSRCSTVCPP